MRGIVTKIGPWLPGKWQDGAQYLNCLVIIKSFTNNRDYKLNIPNNKRQALNQWVPVVRVGNQIDFETWGDDNVAVHGLVELVKEFETGERLEMPKVKEMISEPRRVDLDAAIEAAKKLDAAIEGKRDPETKMTETRAFVREHSGENFKLTDIDDANGWGHGTAAHYVAKMIKDGHLVRSKNVNSTRTGKSYIYTYYETRLTLAERRALNPEPNGPVKVKHRKPVKNAQQDIEEVAEHLREINETKVKRLTVKDIDELIWKYTKKIASNQTEDDRSTVYYASKVLTGFSIFVEEECKIEEA